MESVDNSSSSGRGRESEGRPTATAAEVAEKRCKAATILEMHQGTGPPAGRELTGESDVDR